MLYRILLFFIVFALAACNKEEEALWLAERDQIRLFLQNEGIVPLSSDTTYGYYEDSTAGYFYHITQPGDPTLAKPNARSKVEMHYIAKLLDGTVISETYTSGLTNHITLSDAVPGLQLALLRFHIGTKARIILPSRLGYGEAGLSPDIPANSILIFEVEIIEIHPHF